MNELQESNVVEGTVEETTNSSNVREISTGTAAGIVLIAAGAGATIALASKWVVGKIKGVIENARNKKAATVVQVNPETSDVSNETVETEN